ncbi:16032_t:CDS:2 [Gigaspora rosea]|nr:16032_t:CDS:2 [Gigaspora rosea]
MSDIHLTLSNSCFEIDYSAERQSAASASRKGKGYIGKQTDFMYLQKREGKIFELVFGEYSRLLCSDTKKKEKKDDKIKLWRKTNNWVRQGCKLEKNQFGIIGIQVAGMIDYLGASKNLVGRAGPSSSSMSY